MNATTGLAILAVDDEPRALADIKRLLETSASVDRVATATSAKEALVYLSRRPVRRALPRRRRCPRSRAWRSRACCAASPTRPRSCSSPATRRGRRGLRDPGAGLPRQAGQPRAARRGAAAASRRSRGPRPTPRRARTATARRRPRRRRGPDVVAVDNPKGGGKRLVRLETISIAQANGDYARIVCDDGRFLLRTPLTQLEKDWSPQRVRARAPRVPGQPDARGRAARPAQRHRRAGHARRDRGSGRAAQRRRPAPPPPRLTRRRSVRRIRTATQAGEAQRTQLTTARAATLTIATPATAPGTASSAEDSASRRRTLP